MNLELERSNKATVESYRKFKSKVNHKITRKINLKIEGKLTGEQTEKLTEWNLRKSPFS